MPGPAVFRSGAEGRVSGPGASQFGLGSRCEFHGIVKPVWHEVVGNHHARVVWCSKLPFLVWLVGCLFDVLCLVVAIRLLVADVSPFFPGFFSGVPRPVFLACYLQPAHRPPCT